MLIRLDLGVKNVNIDLKVEKKKEEKEEKAIKQGIIEMIKELYIYFYNNIDLFQMCLGHLFGSLVWSGLDSSLIKLSSMEKYKILNTSFTIGILYSSIGLGCLLGTPLLQAITGNDFIQIRNGYIIGFLIQLSGLLFAAWSPNSFVLFFFGSFYRCIGESLIYIHVVITIQLSTPNKLQGRLFAFVEAGRTLGESFGFITISILYDYIKLDHHTILLIWGGIALIILMIVLSFYFRIIHLFSKNKVKRGLLLFNNI